MAKEDFTEEETGKKYKSYAIKVDPNQDDRASEIKLCSFARPHMRAFHCSWICFHLAFFIWFAIAPLLPEVKESLSLSKSQIWTTNICSVAGTSIMRFVLGPLCDKYGARILMGTVLMAASIPTALIGLARGTVSLSIIRFLIGLGGSSFVMCQYWTTRMFAKEVTGTANALVGGWGNLGGGVTQIVMGTGLFPLFTDTFGMSNNTAWRTVCIVPAVIAFTAGFIVLRISDDCPKGNYKELKRNGLMPEVSATASFRTGSTNLNTWILFIMYGMCFGVELTMNNASASYFKEAYGLSTASASAIASIFGFMNLFARGIGGWSSDKLNSKLGMRGRILVQFICLIGEAGLILVFAYTKDLTSSIIVLVFFSIFVQSAEGSTYGIVPYVDSTCTGAISGIVGAGGNIGAVCLGFVFQNAAKIQTAFIIMSGMVCFAAFLCLALSIRGHRGLLFGQDSEAVENAWKGKEVKAAGTLQVPVMNEA